MIINNINGEMSGSGEITWTQSGNGSTQSRTGTLRVGEYTAPFEPFGDPPYTVQLKASKGFTTEVESPETLVSFFSNGDATKPLNTPVQKP